jgi:hypothetical protein
MPSFNNGYARIAEQVELLGRTLSAKGDDYAGEGNAFDNFEFSADFANLDDAEYCLRMELGKKFKRLRNLFRQPPKNEPIEDTLLDIAGYALIYRAYLEWKKDQP